MGIKSGYPYFVFNGIQLVFVFGIGWMSVFCTGWDKDWKSVFGIGWDKEWVSLFGIRRDKEVGAVHNFLLWVI